MPKYLENHAAWPFIDQSQASNHQLKMKCRKTCPHQMDQICTIRAVSNVIFSSYTVKLELTTVQLPTEFKNTSKSSSSSTLSQIFGTWIVHCHFPEHNSESGGRIFSDPYLESGGRRRRRQWPCRQSNCLPTKFWVKKMIKHIDRNAKLSKIKPKTHSIFFQFILL